MRALIIVITVFIATCIVYWQSPQTLPAPVRSAYAASFSGVSTTLATAANTLWAAQSVGAQNFGARQLSSLPPGWTLLTASLALAAIAVGLISVRRRAVPMTLLNEPGWLSNARAHVPGGANTKASLADCDAISTRLVPDVRLRGESALARAHQLDLYARTAGRLAGTALGSGGRRSRERFVSVSRAALKAVQVSPGAKFFTAYRELDAHLSVLGSERATIDEFYASLADRLAEYEATWSEAHVALAGDEVDEGTVENAMERLRVINREIVAAAATIVGPIEIKVRADG